MKAPETPWGDTCPYLKIANHYNVDYTIVLYAADYLTHGRQIPIGITLVLSKIPLTLWQRVCDDVQDYARRFKAIAAGAER